LLPNGTAIGNTTFWNGTEWVVNDNNIFNAGGNVGIGTNSPSAKLEVSEGDIAINSPYKYKVKDATDGDNFLMYEPTVDGLRLNGYDAVFITTTDPGNTTAGQDLVVRNGRVGINTTTPSNGLLHVNGWYDGDNGAFGFYNSSGNPGTAAGVVDISIYATNRIHATEFNAFSDERIKNIIGQSNSKSDAEIINNIEVTDYTMKDTRKGTKVYKKLIAQQVEEVFPNAVSITTDVIPDVFKMATAKAGLIDLHTNLTVGEKVKLIFEHSELISTVTEVSSKGFKVDKFEDGEVFVYGRQVDDFRTIDYEAVAMLNVSATQESLKRIKALEQENAKLKESSKEILDLRSELEILKKSVSMLINEKSTASTEKK
jgi:hypothetical protein